jgi:Trk K+ transport system NAD-binding subunit
VLLLTLHRGSEFLMPHADTLLAQGDRLTLIGSVDHIEETRRILDVVPIR